MEKEDAKGKIALQNSREYANYILKQSQIYGLYYL